MSHKMTEEQWDQVLAVNLKGTFLCAQAALARMRDTAGGAIVNTSSIGSLGNIGQANYAASKAGVIGLTRTLALESAKFGITVNCVRARAGHDARCWPAFRRRSARDRREVPIGRIARPTRSRAVHAFLASDDARVHHGPGPLRGRRDVASASDRRDARRIDREPVRAAPGSDGRPL